MDIIRHFRRPAALIAVSVMIILSLFGCGQKAEEPIEAPKLFKQAVENCTSANFASDITVSDKLIMQVTGSFDDSMNIKIDTTFPGTVLQYPDLTVYFVPGEKAIYWISGENVFRVQPDDVYDRIMAIPFIGKKYSFLDPDKMIIVNGKKPGKLLVSVFDAEYSGSSDGAGDELLLSLNDDTASRLCEFILNVIKLADPLKQVTSAQTDKLRQYIMKAIRAMKIYAVVDKDEGIFKTVRIELADSLAAVAGELKGYFPDMKLPKDLKISIAFSDVGRVERMSFPSEVKSQAEDMLKYITQTLTQTKQ
ncbi:MAG: hypothetical protein J6S47_07075 [Eubacteriaceae bacterium]|nr:hypothetical protein [Eubacteriaceae bacterium]